MRGRSVFVISEKQIIGNFLDELRAGIPQRQQKKIRGKLRKLGFYITDFDSSFGGFTRSDFDRLIDEGQIVIK